MFVQFRIDWETVRYRYNTIRNDTTRVSIQLPPLPHIGYCPVTGDMNQTQCHGKAEIAQL